MNRPSFLHVGGILYWTIRTRNPDTQVLKDADSTPTVSVRKNGASVGDSVTVTKRSATTGIYDCSYNPAGEVEGDEFTIEESATVTGTTTSSATYANSWEFTVIAVERGTDGANTTTPPTAAANATAVRSELGLTGTLDSAFDAIPTAEENGAAGWDALQADHTSTGSFGAGVGYIITTVAAILVAVNTLTSRITSGVATMFADLIQMITGSGTVNAQFTTKALEQSPAGDGVTVNITPAYVSQQAVVDNNKVTIRRGSRGWVLLTVTDATTGDPIDLSVYTGLKFLVGPAGEATVQTQDVTAFGADNNQFYWKPNEASTLKERQLNWSLFNDIEDTTSQYYRAKPADGVINVLESPV